MVSKQDRIETEDFGFPQRKQLGQDVLAMMMPVTA
jgi:hypothetical protein